MHLVVYQGNLSGSGSFLLSLAIIEVNHLIGGTKSMCVQFVEKNLMLNEVHVKAIVSNYTERFLESFLGLSLYWSLFS